MKGLVAVLLLGLIFSACSSSARKKINRDNKPTQTEQNLNEDFDPSTLSEPAVTIPPKKKVDKNTSDIEMLAAPKDTTESTEEIGYRIQILQTEDAQEAREAQKDAILALDIDAYLIYDNPYYKVRLGDFHTRYEAEEYLQKVIQKGHGSAWIVRTHIKPHLEKEQNQ